MGHNSVVSGHPKSTGISWVDELSTGPPKIGESHNQIYLSCVAPCTFGVLWLFSGLGGHFLPPLNTFPAYEGIAYPSKMDSNCLENGRL